MLVYDSELFRLRQALLPLGLDPAPFWKELVFLAKALEEAGEDLNLTAVKGIPQRLKGPFWEALFLAAHLPRLSPAADLGTGAGIPGLVVKLARPELEIFLIEAYAPRVEFMKEIIKKLALSGVHPLLCHVGKESCGLNTPLVFSRGYGEVGKFVRHAVRYFGAKEAYYLWRKDCEPWREGELPLKLSWRKPLPERSVELLMWSRS